MPWLMCAIKPWFNISPSKGTGHAREHPDISLSIVEPLAIIGYVEEGYNRHEATLDACGSCRPFPEV